MPAKLQSIALVGLGAESVTVEVDLASGLPSFTIVGLADKAVDEARERVRAAIKNSGFKFPDHRITVNLAPADLPKIGPAYDLPIALAILVADGTLPPDRLDGVIAVGELALAGEVRPVDGIVPMTLALKSTPPRLFILPTDNLPEAQLVGDLPLVPARDLRGLVEELLNGITPTRRPRSMKVDIAPPPLTDLATIGGLEQVKRALEIAAAGNHNVLLIGPPGTGKTLLARAFASILPELTPDEYLEVLTIRSAAGLLKPEDLIYRTRPVRSPHHTASSVALVGGGTKVRPGEVSLAHRGVLFLDEFPEFPRHVLEALREPLEEGTITVARAQGAISFPARFILLAAANPCPCGYYGDPDKTCQCGPAALLRYQRKLSGPLLDRIDLVVSVPRQAAQVILDQPVGESSAEVRARVMAARSRQATRYGTEKQLTNGELSAPAIKHHIHLTDEARAILLEAGERLHLSGRALHRLLKVAQTIADLEVAPLVDQVHITEAMQYRYIESFQR